jgi:hypothetical protein
MAIFRIIGSGPSQYAHKDVRPLGSLFGLLTSAAWVCGKVDGYSIERHDRKTSRTFETTTSALSGWEVSTSTLGCIPVAAVRPYAARILRTRVVGKQNDRLRVRAAR